MQYLTRILVAGLFSAIVHLLIIVSLGLWTPESRHLASYEPEPIVLNLQPEPEPETDPVTRRLVDPTMPTEAPEVDTENIAEFDATAADETLQEGDQSGPLFEEEAESDLLAAPASPSAMSPPTPPETAPVPEPEPEPEPAPEPVPPPSPAVEETPTVTTPSEAPPAMEAQAPETSEDSDIEPETATEPDQSEPELPEAFQVAQAEPETPPTQPSGASRGLQNEVRNRGFTNYDAIQDDLAPYLREIRQKVERRWNEALLTRYSGSSPTAAVVDSAIAPDGSLVYVEIIGAPRDQLFAALCRDAIERAGPFAPFPFEVPDLYRNQNLEIRWTFNFL